MVFFGFCCFRLSLAFKTYILGKGDLVKSLFISDNVVNTFFFYVKECKGWSFKWIFLRVIAYRSWFCFCFQFI